MSEAERRLIEAKDAWPFHEHVVGLLAGYGHHMQQMLHRLPRDGQTDDMRASIEQMLADLRDTLDALASREARLAAVEVLTDEREMTETIWSSVPRRLRAALRSDPDEASTP